ncbi:MAG: phosphonate ABC transporter, permease protein PhnE, partial [Paracoccaceae bacterium]|nr:phosphonate ABC transporter, permease protein PhnE [Paracoccaceae bacterium]
MSALTLQDQTIRTLDRRRRIALAVPVLILAYLAYVAVAFDLGGLAQRARMDNARILLADAVSYKLHVTRDNRRETLQVSVEGNGRAAYPADRLPDWIEAEGPVTRIELGG